MTGDAGDETTPMAVVPAWVAMVGAAGVVGVIAVSVGFAVAGGSSPPHAISAIGPARP